MEDSEQNCLICLAHGVPLRKPTSANESCSKEDSLNCQIQVMVLLRKVLCLRNSFLESLLQSYEGRNPSSWDLKLCHLCFRIFEEAMFIFDRLNKLNVEFEEISRLLRSKMIQVVGTKALEQGEGGASNCTIKRKAGRPPRKRRLPAKDDNSVSAKIRREFALRHSHCPEALRKVVKSEDSKVAMQLIRTAFSGTVRCDTEEPDDDDPLVEDDSLQDLLNDDIEDLYSNGLSMDVHTSNNPSPVLEGEEEWEGKSDNDKGSADTDERSDEDNDSDFEPTRSSSRNNRTSKKRKYIGMNYINLEDQRALASAIKMENAGGFQCSECQQTFSSSAQCDEHIMHDHYGGAWPKKGYQPCPVCPKRFNGQGRLRSHLKNHHPDYKLPADQALERCIEKGTVPEITYDVVPFGGKSSKYQLSMSQVPGKADGSEAHLSKSNLIRTVEEAPPNCFSVPVIQHKNGNHHYVVLPESFIQAMSDEVLSLLTRGPVDKKCDRCEWTAPTEMQLRAHIKRSHEGEESCYNCPMCPKSYGRIKKVLTHMQKTHVHGKFVCDKCGDLFKEEIMLRAHIQRVHLGITHPFECVKCGAKSPTRSVLNKHMKSAHKIQIVKPPRIRRAAGIRQPVKKRSKPVKNIPCKLCQDKTLRGRPIKFATEQELEVHVKRKHLGISRPYPCPVCGRKYSSPWVVDEHLQTHTVRNDVEVDSESPPPTEEFICHPCDKAFKNKTRFETHLKGRNHENLKPFVCEVCSRPFTTIRILEAHQALIHHEELRIEPFKCKFCDKLLGCERTLNAHIRVRHTKEANFKCPDCDCYFEWKHGLERHVEVRHAKLNPLMCPYCPKSFAHDMYLKNHLRIHTGEKPYQCSVCSKKFADKSTYNRHVEAHSDIVHDCSICKKTGFKTRHALRVHMKIRHKEEVENLDRESKLKQHVLPATANSRSVENDSPQLDMEGATATAKSERPSTSEDLERDNIMPNLLSEMNPLMGE